jgi:hypothetical protein
MSCITNCKALAGRLTLQGAFWAILTIAGFTVIDVDSAMASPASAAAEHFAAGRQAAGSATPLLTPVHGHGGHGGGGGHYHGGGGGHYHGGGGGHYHGGWGGHYHGGWGHHYYGYGGPYFYYGGPSYYYDYDDDDYYYRPYYYSGVNRAYRRCRAHHGPRYCRLHWRRYR